MINIMIVIGFSLVSSVFIVQCTSKKAKPSSSNKSTPSETPKPKPVVKRISKNRKNRQSQQKKKLLILSPETELAFIISTDELSRVFQDRDWEVEVVTSTDKNAAEKSLDRFIAQEHREAFCIVFIGHSTEETISVKTDSITKASIYKKLLTKPDLKKLVVFDGCRGKDTNLKPDDDREELNLADNWNFNYTRTKQDPNVKIDCPNLVVYHTAEKGYKSFADDWYGCYGLYDLINVIRDPLCEGENVNAILIEAGRRKINAWPRLSQSTISSSMKNDSFILFPK